MPRIWITLLLLITCTQLFAKDIQNTVRYEKRVVWGGKEKEILSFDMSDFKHVRDLDAYDPVKHVEPIRQDTTGTCWCFCGTSMLESELMRMGQPETPLSRMFTVYWEYVEKCRYYVQTKGESLVAQGSQIEAMLNRIRQYGLVRASDYDGLVDGETVYNHRGLLKEITIYLDYIKENELWYEDQVVQNVRAILDRHMGPVPESITVNGETLTPLEYLEKTGLNPDDYVAFISFKKYPFWTMQEYDVPDNWWDSDNYYNVPLENFYDALKKAIQNGYSAAIFGDVSEPGKYGWEDIAVVPSFDIPSSLINQDSREFRFYNETSTDDHGVHLVGYKRYKGEDWFLIKDSAASAWRGDFDGYHFFHGDYIKLKILGFIIHKDAVQNLLSEFE